MRMARRSKFRQLDEIGPTMIGRSLTRRLEHLETRLLLVAGEPMVITVDFVDVNGTVVDHKEFVVAAPPPNEPSPWTRPWRR